MGQASEPAYEAKLAYNAAIANLAQHFENCYLIELTKYNTLIASGYDYLRSQSRNAHYNAIAYNYISDGDNDGKIGTGWRVFDINGDNVTLISAGNPEDYYHGEDAYARCVLHTQHYYIHTQ